MSAVNALVSQVEERVRRDPDFARLLDALLDVPTVPMQELECIAARTLNSERRDGVLSGFRAGAVVADRIMRIKRDELAGASISEALRRKKTAHTARQLLDAVGA